MGLKSTAKKFGVWIAIALASYGLSLASFCFFAASFPNFVLKNDQKCTNIPYIDLFTFGAMIGLVFLVPIGAALGLLIWLIVIVIYKCRGPTSESGDEFPILASGQARSYSTSQRDPM